MSKETEKFLDLYRELETVGRREYYPNLPRNENIIGKLIRHQSLKNYQEDINFCRVVRNFITHNPKVAGNYPIEPSEQMIKLLARVIEAVKNPYLAISSSIKKEDMVIATKTDKVIDIMGLMDKYAYTHVPIIENGVLLGVFSDHAICSYMIERKYFKIDDDTVIGELEKFLQIESHKSEFFAFVDNKTRLHEVEELFKNNYKDSKILAAVFITCDGSPKSLLEGMITPWDLLSDEQ